MTKGIPDRRLIIAESVIQSDREKIEALLDKAGKRAYDLAYSKALERTLPALTEYIPVFRDYYSGLAADEACREHRVIRAEFYKYMREWNLPSLGRRSGFENLNNRLATLRDGKIRSTIENCTCLGCIWMRGRESREHKRY